jgi:hypothetical protein
LQAETVNASLLFSVAAYGFIVDCHENIDGERFCRLYR